MVLFRPGRTDSLFYGSELLNIKKYYTSVKEKTVSENKTFCLQSRDFDIPRAQKGTWIPRVGS